MNENEWEGIHDASQINDDYLRQLLAPCLDPDKLKNIHVKNRDSISGTRYYLVYGTPDPAHENACPRIQAGDTVPELLDKLDNAMLQAGAKPVKKSRSASAVFPAAEFKEKLLLQVASELTEPVFAQYFAHIRRKNSKNKWHHYLYLDTSQNARKRVVMIDMNLQRSELEEKINILFRENHFLKQVDMLGLLQPMYQKYLNVFEPYGFTLNNVFCKLKKAEEKGIIVHHGFQLTENQEHVCGISELKTYQFVSEDFLLYPSEDQFGIDILYNKKVHSKIQACFLELSGPFSNMQLQFKTLMLQVLEGLQKYPEICFGFVELQRRPYELEHLLAFCQSDAFIFSCDDCIPYLKAPGYKDDVYDNALLFSFAGTIKSLVSSEWQRLICSIKNERVLKQCQELRFLINYSLFCNDTEKCYTVQIECLGASQKLNLSISRKDLAFEENRNAAIDTKVRDYLLLVKSHAENICGKRQQICRVATDKRLMNMIIAIDRTNKYVHERYRYHFSVYSYLKLFRLGIARVFPGIDYSDLTALKALESAETSDIAALLKTALVNNVFQNNVAANLQVRKRRLTRLLAASAHHDPILTIRKKVKKSELDSYLLLRNAVKYMLIAGKEANPQDVLELIEQLELLNSIDPPMVIQFIQLLPDKYLPYLKLRRHLQGRCCDQNVQLAETLRISVSHSLDTAPDSTWRTLL